MGLAKILSRETSLCVKCGACRSVCPVFSVVSRENGSARGKIALAKQFVNREEFNGKKFQEAIQQCLLCMSCTEVCANRVRTDMIILTMRERLGEKSIIKEEFSKFLKAIAFQHLTFASDIFRFLQKILMKKNYTGDLQRLKIRFPGFNGRYFPVLKNRAFMNNVDEVVNGEKNTRYAFFVGCMLNVAYQGIADKTRHLMIKTRATVLIPKKQICCGLPLLADGDIEEARGFAIQNLKAFEDVSPDRIVVACASCGSMLREYYPYIFDGTEYEERAIRFAGKIIDISQLLAEEKTIFKRNDTTRRVTFHDPCHLKRGMGIHEEPREIIVRYGYELLEMTEADRCCGFSGLFSFTYPELSNEILTRKIENAVSTGSETLVTSCPGCIMQLKSGVENKKVNLKVKHLVELIE